MLFYLWTYILGFYSGIFYTKKSFNIKKELDSIVNNFLEKTNMNNKDSKILNDYMDLINNKLDNLINMIYQKKEVDNNTQYDKIDEKEE